MKTKQIISKSINRFNFYITLTMLSSIGFNIYVNHQNYNALIGGVLFQFFGSMVLGYVASQFKAKYKENDWRKIWLGIYVFMVVSSIMSVILGIYPDHTRL